MDKIFGQLHLANTPRQGASFHQRHAHNYYVMGKRRAEDGALDDAERLLKRALHFNPVLTAALHTLANIELARNRHLAARAYAERAITANPNDPEAYALLGNIALSDRKPADALDAFAQARQNGGDGLELHYNTGLAHLLLGQGDEAALIFTRLTDEQPLNHRAWDALGCARRMLKDSHSATNAFLQALTIDPQFNDARDHLAQLFLELGKLTRARQVLEAALAIDPYRPTTRHLLGMTFSASQEFDHAAECWEGLIAQGGATSETYHLLANAYLHLDDTPRACTVLESLTKLYPQHIAGHLQLALLLLETGEQERGYQHLDVARALDPHNPAIAHVLAATELLTKHTLPASDPT
ncbi:MAG TPA: tetratricopeptide repeat protein [Armatimonadota bacterium]